MLPVVAKIINIKALLTRPLKNLFTFIFLASTKSSSGSSGLGTPYRIFPGSCLSKNSNKWLFSQAKAPCMAICKRYKVRSPGTTILWAEACPCQANYVCTADQGLNIGGDDTAEQRQLFQASFIHWLGSAVTRTLFDQLLYAAANSLANSTNFLFPRTAGLCFI